MRARPVCRLRLTIFPALHAFATPRLRVRSERRNARHTRRKGLQWALFSHSKLRRMMLTGLRVFGPELYRLGVVEECVAQDELAETALDLAREIAEKSPVAIKLAKQGLNQIEEMSLRDGYRHEQNLTAEVRKSADSKEAMQAFVEKRKPVFTGN